MEVDKKRVTSLSLTIVAGGLANLFLLLSLGVTWKYWRQVKWYVALLALGNCLELAFRFGMELGWTSTITWEAGSEASCKLLMMLRAWGPQLAGMALAALSVHSLLTVITGSQGDRARHWVVMGIFVMLSLPVPLTMLAIYKLETIPSFVHPEGGQQCVSFHFFHTPLNQFLFRVGFVFAMTYFPLFVFLVCFIIATVLNSGRKGNVKADEHVSDLIVTGIVGVVELVCCVPFQTFLLVLSWQFHMNQKEGKPYTGLLYLEHCRIIFSALLVGGFAYLYVYRKRGEIQLTPISYNETIGERQKLVN
ncbi:adipokinetic hormone/corazonin-related peptide receptor variant I-like [Babylonia areolata]|uniref:adipokinetic hormone/corazonin-related peptide receptor variant I-like n=1 Tax=Babylonia areolata TaxID=304850 RepID=UPI003FD3A7A4